MTRPAQISVIGSGTCAQDSELALLAEEVGRRLAEAGAVVVCGGLAGVMEAASRGAAQAGGTVVGIIPSDSVQDANPHCTHVVATGIGYARNLAVVASGEAVIAVGGEWGTLSEIGFARNLGRSVAALRSCRHAARGRWPRCRGSRSPGPRRRPYRWRWNRFRDPRSEAARSRTCAWCGSV